MDEIRLCFDDRLFDHYRWVSKMNSPFFASIKCIDFCIGFVLEIHISVGCSFGWIRMIIIESFNYNYILNRIFSAIFVSIQYINRKYVELQIIILVWSGSEEFIETYNHRTTFVVHTYALTIIKSLTVIERLLNSYKSWSLKLHAWQYQEKERFNTLQLQYHFTWNNSNFDGEQRWMTSSSLC